MKKAIGIDIGGTKISVVIGDASGKIHAQKVIPTRTGNQVPQVLKEIVSAIQELVKPYPRKSLAGIGVGIPGPVNSKKGIVPCSPHLKGWEGLRLQKILESKTGLKTVLANDANAAALGEKIFGQGRDVQDFIYMTVSTGIGGGVVVNGRLIEGTGYVAGEVGHMTLVPDGDSCKCGKTGCLEAYASGTALANFAKRELKRTGKSALPYMKDGQVTAQALGQAAKKGDALAIGVYRRCGFYLGIGVANLLNILNPQKVVLGGGVWKSAPKEFWKSMMQSCRREAWPEAMKTVKILPSNLKGHAGDLGSLALAFENFK